VYRTWKSDRLLAHPLYFTVNQVFGKPYSGKMAVQQLSDGTIMGPEGLENRQDLTAQCQAMAWNSDARDP